MTKLLVFLVIAALMILPLSAQAKTPDCPECGGSAYFTGKSRTNSAGRLMYQYQCMMFSDHKFWARAN